MVTNQQQKKSPSRGRAIFIVGYALFLIILVELFSAIYVLSGIGIYSHIPPYISYLFGGNDQVASPADWRTEIHEWGSWHKPNSQSVHSASCFKVKYSSNSYGARDKEREVNGSSQRYLIVGDSYVEGYGVDVGARFTDLLEANLNREFLNFGTGGNAGPLQYEILYKKLASKFRHDTLLIGILPANDFTDNDIAYWKDSKRYRPYYGDNGAFYPVESGDDGVGIFGNSRIQHGLETYGFLACLRTRKRYSLDIHKKKVMLVIGIQKIIKSRMS